MEPTAYTREELQEKSKEELIEIALELCREAYGLWEATQGDDL